MSRRPTKQKMVVTIVEKSVVAIVSLVIAAVLTQFLVTDPFASSIQEYWWRYVPDSERDYFLSPGMQFAYTLGYIYVPGAITLVLAFLIYKTINWILRKLVDLWGKSLEQKE